MLCCLGCQLLVKTLTLLKQQHHHLVSKAIKLTQILKDIKEMKILVECIVSPLPHLSPNPTKCGIVLACSHDQNDPRA